MGKTLILKLKKIWVQLSIFSVILMRCMCLHRKKRLLKVDFVLYTVVFVAPKIVLNKYY